MAEVNGKTVAIYATPANAAIMEKAKSIGVNVSKVCNNIWDKHLVSALQEEVEQKAKELRRLLKTM